MLPTPTESAAAASAERPVLTYDWHDMRHHTPSGFRNPWPLAPSPDDADGTPSARFIFEFLLGSKEQTPVPVERPDPASLAAPVAEGMARVTWLGHATCLVQFPTLTLLTDPVWASRVGPFGVAGPKRQAPPPLVLEDLPPIHAVVLSHDHYDHLDPVALRAIQVQHRPRFFVPLGVEKWLPPGADATALDWGQAVDMRGIRLSCLPARHFSGRTLRDRDATLWASWFFASFADDTPNVYFAGDSGYAPHFRQVRERLGAPDLVLMPVGAYRPRRMMRPVHVDPPEALDALEDLGAGALVPIHWGTYDLAEEPLNEPPEVLAAAAEHRSLGDRLRILPTGGTSIFKHD